MKVGSSSVVLDRLLEQLDLQLPGAIVLLVGDAERARRRRADTAASRRRSRSSTGLAVEDRLLDAEAPERDVQIVVAVLIA